MKVYACGHIFRENEAPGRVVVLDDVCRYCFNRRTSNLRQHAINGVRARNIVFRGIDPWDDPDFGCMITMRPRINVENPADQRWEVLDGLGDLIGHVLQFTAEEMVENIGWGFVWSTWIDPGLEEFPPADPTGEFLNEDVIKALEEGDHGEWDEEEEVWRLGGIQEGDPVIRAASRVDAAIVAVVLEYLSDIWVGNL